MVDGGCSVAFGARDTYKIVKRPALGLLLCMESDSEPQTGHESPSYLSSVPEDLARGDFYEDCASQPVVCTEVDTANDVIAGISLLTGQISTCSIENCGVRKLDPDEALDRATHWETWAAQHGLDPDRANY